MNSQGGTQNQVMSSYFSVARPNDSPRLKTNSVGEGKKIENINNIIGRRIDYNLNENVLDSRRSTNIKKFPLMVETTEKRLNRQNLNKYYPGTVKNQTHSPFDEGSQLETLSQQIYVVDSTPQDMIRKSRMNTQQNESLQSTIQKQQRLQLQMQSEGHQSNYNNYRQNENNINANNVKQLASPPMSAKPKKQIVMSTLQSPASKPLSASNSQLIRTVNINQITPKQPVYPHSQNLSHNKKTSKKKIVVNKKSLNESKEQKEQIDQSEYQLNGARRGSTEISHSPHSKKSHTKKNTNKNNTHSQSHETFNIKQQQAALQNSQTQQKIAQLQNQKTVQSSKNTQRSSHSPIDSPKQQKSKQLTSNGNGNSSNLKKRNTNSQLSKRRDSEVYKEQISQKEINQHQEDMKRVQSERMQKLKQLVDQNIKRALLEKQRKAEEKRFEEELKKEKQIQMLQKNQSIRLVNASRFSRNKINSNDLSRRLPWGINQEKLRNYAIQVLIQYRNQDQRSQSENNNYKYDDSQRRKQIGLDNLTEEEIQRLVQVNKERMKESQIEEDFINYHHLLTLQRREQQDLKKEEVLSYMEIKKQRVEREEFLKKQQKLEQEQLKREKKQNLEKNINSIFKRLKNQKSQNRSKSKIQQNQYQIPIQQNSINRQSSSKNIHSSSKFQSPSSQQDYQQYQLKTEFNTHNNESDSHLKSRQIKTEEASTYQINNPNINNKNLHVPYQYLNSPLQQAFLAQQYSTQMSYQNPYTTQQDDATPEEDDYSGLYEEFKQLITGNDDNYLQDMYKSPQYPLSQLSSQKNPSFYRTGASSQKNFNTQPSATASKILSKKKKTPSKSGKKNKKKGNTDSSGKKKKKSKQQLSQQLESEIHTNNEINGSDYLSSSKINAIQMTKQKYEDLAKRFIQIKLNTSKNDSTTNNNLTKTNKQLLMNGEIEEKIESEDFESSRKEYENNHLHQVAAHQPHLQFQFDQATHHPYHQAIGQMMDPFSNSPGGFNQSDQIRQSQQRNDNIIEQFDSPQKGFEDSINGKQIEQQEHSSGSVIIKDSDIKPDQMLENNLLQSNEAFYKQLEMQQRQFDQEEDSYPQSQQKKVPSDKKVEIQQQSQQEVQQSQQKPNEDIKKNYDSLDVNENEYQQDNLFTINNQQTELSFNVGDDELDQQQQMHKGNNQNQQQYQEEHQDEEEEEEEEMNEEQLEQLAQEIFNNAATYIQKIWRGYFTQILENGEIDENGNFNEAQLMEEAGHEVEEDQEGEEVKEEEYQKYMMMMNQYQQEQNEMQREGHQNFQQQQSPPSNKNNKLKSQSLESSKMPQANFMQQEQAPNQQKGPVKANPEVQNKQQQGKGEPLNNEWLQKQEKEELLQHENLVEDEDDQFDFQGDQENNEKFVHISTIKSSVISNDEVQFQKIDTILNSQSHLQNQEHSESGGKYLNQSKSDKKMQQQPINTEEYEENDQEEYEQFNAQQSLEQFINEMSEEDMENWNEVQIRINALTQSNDPDQKNKIIEILQDLTPLNRERLLLLIDDNEEDSQNFSIEQIEAVFRNHPQSQYASVEQKDQNYPPSIQPQEEVKPAVANPNQGLQTTQQGTVAQAVQSAQQPQDQKNKKNNIQIDIQIIEEDQQINNQNKFPNLSKPSTDIKQEDQKQQNEIQNQNNDNNNNNLNTTNENLNNADEYQTKTPLNPTKSIDRQSTNSKNNSAKREKSHSFNYEAQSERSFNQMRRNKQYHSPKDQRQGLRNALSVQSDDTRSLEAVSPKEELNQLYALLQQEQMQAKKDKIISKNVSSKGSSLKGSARNINKDLQQEMLNEYFESSQENPYLNNTDKMNNNSASSIFDKDSFKEFTEKKLKQIMNEENINEILKLREQALEMRHKSQMNAMNQLLSENHVSPRTYDSKKIELETWVKNEKEEIHQTRKALERGLMKAMESIKKTQRDVQLAQRYKNNPSKFDSRSSFASEEEYLFRRKFEQEGASNRSDSDTHSDNLSSSQALKYLLKEVGTPTSRNNIKIIDKFEVNEKADGENEADNLTQGDKPGQDKKYKKSSISKKYNKRYADGDNGGDEDDDNEDEEYASTEGVDKELMMRFKDKQASPQPQAKKDGTLAQPEEETPHKKSPSSQKDVLPGQGVKLILDYNDFDSANNNGESQNLKIPTLSSSNESLSFQQQNLDRLINEKMVLKKDGSQSGKSSKKSPRFEDNSFPFSPLSDASKELYQFQSVGAPSTAAPKDDAQVSEEQARGSPSKKSPRDAASSLKESNSEEDEIEELKFYEDKEFHDRHAAFQQLAQPSAEFMERNEILAEMQDRWRTFNQIDQRIQEQLQKIFAQDKSDNYGIATNLKIITDYIDRLFNYVVERYQDEFLENLNTPFGFAPSKRLKLIHGYDSFVDSSCSDEGGNNVDDYNTLPFVLSEELFIEFEQNVIGNGESEKEQIIKEFEHIHNKAIFDTFNEALNIFRPYYTLGGPPYSWTKSEKNLVLGRATNKNLSFILEKSKARVIEWGTYLCGLVNEEEVQRQIPLEDEKGNPPPLSVLLENLTPQNEYLAQVREERLSKMLLTEIFENEYKWQLYEDEKAEVVMELADLVFEELVEEIVNDMSEK